MHLPHFLAAALVFFIGFIAHRASLCTVKAVIEISTSGTTHMLASFLRAALWASAIAAALAFVIPGVGAGVMQRTPAPYAIAGGFIFGVGAAMNGGCSLSTLQGLADGDLNAAVSLAGFATGISLMTWLDRQFTLGTLGPIALPWMPDGKWSEAIMTVIWVWVVFECLRLRKAWPRQVSLFEAVTAPVYRLSPAAAVIGVAGGLLYAWPGAWTYTNYARSQAFAWINDVPITSSFGVLYVAALLAGMVASSLQRRTFAVRLAPREAVLRRAGGGLMMGVGGALIPGGNDTLILSAIPSLSPQALVVYLALLAGIATTLGLTRLFFGPLSPISCADDRCS